LAAQADLTVSFWSSAITDSLAVMTPAIEFHKHDVIHDQLIWQGNRLISIFHQLGFCEFFEHGEELIQFIEKQTKESLAEILVKQRQNFEEVFGNDIDMYARLDNIFNENFKIASERNVFELVRSEVLFKIIFSFFSGRIKKLLRLRMLNFFNLN
jgi:hypothetical protein